MEIMEFVKGVMFDIFVRVVVVLFGVVIVVVIVMFVVFMLLGEI